MHEQLVLLEEPLLAFGYSQTSPFPKDGLLLYGPPTEQGQPTELRYGVVSTANGAKLMNEWVKKIQRPIPSHKPGKAHFQYWPGFTAVFGAKWSDAPIVAYTINPLELSQYVRLDDRHHAIYKSVGLYVDAITKHIREEERQPDLWFVVIPDEIFQYGRPASRVPSHMQQPAENAIGKKAARDYLMHGDLFDDLTEEARMYQFDLDFRAQLKARLLGKAVVQIVRESTLSGGEYIENMQLKQRKMQDPATTAWNLCTTAFFKAQGRPWHLASVREGVCYVGIVFKKDDTQTTQDNVCCGAQMFLNSGDGVVFRGAMGPWTADDKSYHLSTAAAANLMSTVISAYEAKHGVPPSEVFIHGQAEFNDDEWKGFMSAIGNHTMLCGVRIRKSNRVKAFRAGRKPLARGTAWFVGKRKAYLWSSGYVPRLATYPGWEVPNPLQIDLLRGEADIATVVQDVLALTKLNYNACLYGDSKPVTLRFAEEIGDVLTATPDKDQPPLPFRYYI